MWRHDVVCWISFKHIQSRCRDCVSYDRFSLQVDDTIKLHPTGFDELQRCCTPGKTQIAQRRKNA